MLPGMDVRFAKGLNRRLKMHLYNTLNQTDKARRWAGVNTAPGTAIAGPGNLAAFSDINALFALANSAAVNTQPGRGVVPDYVKLIANTPGTGVPRFVVTLDNIPRGVTANSNVVIGNADSDSLATASSIAFVQLGALTPTAASTKRAIIAQDYLRGAALIAGDEILITFAEPTTGLGSTVATISTRMHFPIGLVTLGPGGLLLIHSYGQTTATTWELEAGWWELS